MPNKGVFERARCPECKKVVSCSRAPYDGPSHLRLREHGPRDNPCPSRRAEFKDLVPGKRVGEGRKKRWEPL